MSFAKRFVDASERYSVKRTKHKTETTVAYVDKILRKSKSHSAVVNLHNNRVGRKVKHFSLFVYIFSTIHLEHLCLLQNRTD